MCADVGYSVPHGARGPGPGGDARARRRLVPRQRLAARADPAPPRPRRPLRLRLPRPARPATSGAQTPAGRPGRGLHRPARLGGGLHPRRRLDRPRRRPRDCSPARATSRSPARRARPRPPPITGAVDGAAADDARATPTRSRRIREDPRVTRPYSDRAVGADRRARRRGRRDAEAGDVRLTMGGEPTFVVGGRHGGAGVEHRGRSARPSARSAPSSPSGSPTRFAPGALIQHGQGKWYPGEPLPRWQIGVYWRTDGQPLWRDPRCWPTPRARAAATPADARALVAAIAAALGPARRRRCVPAYEDPLDRCRAEARLPAGDPPPRARRPRSSRSGPRRRAARARRSSPSLDAERGEPGRLRRSRCTEGSATPAWSTGRWTLRRGHLFLVPGDSPMGLRLPLDSLTWTPAAARPGALAASPRAAAPRPRRRPDRRRRPRPSGRSTRRRSPRSACEAARRARPRLPAAARPTSGTRSS